MLSPPDATDPARGRSLTLARVVFGLAGATSVVLALAVTPDLVARHLSPDGRLNGTTADALNFLRGAAALFGGGLLLAALHKRWAYFSLRTIVDANADAWPWAVLAAGIALLLTGMGFAVSAATDTPVIFLLRDPNAIAEMPLYYGALEYAGAILMAGSAGIAIFSSTLSSGATARFLALGGLLTLLLVCDDLYMLHENSAQINLNERIVFGIYGTLALVFAVTNLNHLLASPFALLGAAGVFLASGLVLDRYTGLARQLPGGSEELLELVGICFWSAYFIKCSRNALRSTGEPGTGQQRARGQEKQGQCR